ncbi:hypothetical protein K443DRAFT_673156 [Laccaria amethystina LaAM-08-1]|uniref:Uncharacterized protein n=1 Tax=Laccaria amethystina LaAM-08-1 TaxID=1095629 RepID=A0A0C9X5X4_9AGAR|nr:hypothetical protein K443DRAFT_673156 [Laccaria amethystina LaAM-08-1]
MPMSPTGSTFNIQRNSAVIVICAQEQCSNCNEFKKRILVRSRQETKPMEGPSKL